MEPKKRKRLEATGWRIGSVPDFLDERVSERSAKNPEFPKLVKKAETARKAKRKASKTNFVPTNWHNTKRLLTDTELQEIVDKLSAVHFAKEMFAKAPWTIQLLYVAEALLREREMLIDPKLCVGRQIAIGWEPDGDEFSLDSRARENSEGRTIYSHHACKNHAIAGCKYCKDCLLAIFPAIAS